MDVDLATPAPVSLDTAIAIVGLGLAGVGGYRVFTQVGTEAGLAGWILIAVGWVMVAPRLFMGLSLSADAVEVRIVTGTRRIPLDEIDPARVVDARLGVRWLGAGASGYHTGWHHLSGEGRLKAYTSRIAGPFVLLERAWGAPVVVSPADPDEMLEALEERSVQTVDPQG